jgi:predicted ATP-grasp superfamily ATP-dependent carboligase
MPGVETSPRRLRQALITIGQCIQTPAVVFPATDSSVTTLARIIHQLPQYVASIPSLENVELMVNKKQFYTSLRALNIPHPKTLAFPEASIEEILTQLSFPVFIKPVYSQPFSALFRRKGYTAHSEQELSAFLQLITRYRQPVLIQEMIPGPVPNGYVLRGYFDVDSTPQAVLVAQILRQPSMFANMSCMLSVPRKVLQGFDEIIIEYLHNRRYHGLFLAQVKWDPRDNSFKLLEINARSSGANALSARSGAHEVQYAYWEALGQKCPPSSSITLGVYFVNEVIDVESIVSMIRYHTGSVTSLLRSYLAPARVFGVWSRDDPKPIIALGFQKMRQRVPSIL